MKKINYWFFFFFLLILIGCKSPDKRIGPADAEHLYLDYKITGEEGYDKLTILARFLYGGRNGESIFLESPYKIELDGEVLPVDSSVMAGPFYELNKTIAEFTGKHSFVFTGPGGEKQKEEFEFSPMSLLEEIPDTLQRGELIFELKGLEKEDFVRVLMTDTSVFNDGIDKLDTVYNGRLTIRAEDLENIGSGPVNLELIRERDQLIKKGDRIRGRLHFSYMIRRSFFLKDRSE